MKICFLVGSLQIGGGTFVILQHADYLSSCGHDVTLALDEPPSQIVKAWHPALERLRWAPTSSMRETQDVVIATWWMTAYDLWNVPARRHTYFVQSIESRFYGVQDHAIRAAVDATYTFPVPVITEATWIQELLEVGHGRSVHLVRNGMAKELYNPVGTRTAPPSHEGLRILVEGPLGVPFKNVARTVALCRAADVGPVWLLTPTRIRSYSGVERVFSQVPVRRTAEIYRSCDVLVKLSYVEGMFGPPLEMFHCGGTALAYAVTGHDEYMRHGVNSVIVPVGDERAVVEALRELRARPHRLLELKAGARATAERWPDWDQSSEQFGTAIAAVLAGPETPAGAHSDAMKAWADYTVASATGPSGWRGRGVARLRLLRQWLASNHPRVFEAAVSARYRAEARRLSVRTVPEMTGHGDTRAKAPARSAP